MRRAAEGGDASPDGRLSPDLRRLLLGVLFMALLATTSLAAAFLWGRPGPGAVVAPGVLVLAGGGAVLVVAAAVTFYRTYRDR